MGGKSGGSAVKSQPTTVEGQDYWDRYPDVAASGLNPYYHYEKYGKNEGRTYGSPPQQQEMGFGFEMPSFEMPKIPDYSAMQANAQAEAEKRMAMANIDSLYRNKFAAANAAIDKVNSQIADEMAYAKVGGADYKMDENMRKERINNMFASLWSEGDESRLASLEGQYGSGGNRWTLDIVRGAKASDKGALEEKEGEKAGGAVDPSKVLSKVLGGSTEDDEADKLGGVFGQLGG